MCLIQWGISSVFIWRLLWFALVWRVIRVIALSIFWLQHRKSLGKASAISGYALILTSKWEFFPNGVVHWLTLHINKIFFTRSALHRPERFLCKHGIFHALCRTLFGKQLKNLPDLFAQLGKSFHHFITVRKIVQHVLQVANLVLRSMFKINKIILFSLKWHLIHKEIQVAISILFVTLKIWSQLLDFCY